MSHFLFIAGALRERTSSESTELQLGHRVWGLCTALIHENLQKYLTSESHGLIYVLKLGICAHFKILSGVLPFQQLDELLKDDLRTEARHGFIRVELLHRWQSSPATSHALLQEVLHISDQAELTRRLTLGMHRLTEEEYRALLKKLE